MSEATAAALKRPATILLLLCAILSAGVTARAAEPGPRTLLAVFAHPDDETAVMPLLSRYARQGDRVYLVFATDGAKGEKPHIAIPAGERLAGARAHEAQCAAERLGIRPPILLGLADGGLAKPANIDALHRALERLMDELKPDAVVTWGPGGGSGHIDHRMVSSVVTEVVQLGDRGATEALFYVSFPRDAVESLPPFSSEVARRQRLSLRATDRRYLPVRVGYDREDRLKTQKALDCYRSQLTPVAAAELLQLLDHVCNGTIYLRSWNGAVKGADLFESAR